MKDQSLKGKVFSDLISDRNTPSKGLIEKQFKMREGQRKNLVRMGIKRNVKKIIQGR